ncbi:MAG TPA: valine--tRNA ligase [Chloroflexota bacterium]|nr:valine--tRNA ligase [Chloroflexota bacterium]
MTLASRPELSKHFDFQSVEPARYRFWEDGGYFKPRPAAGKPPFVISIPPPNVTGELHLGHALFVTIEDILIRYHRMRGEPTLWVPGTDHAGIATQKVVEDLLAREGTSRHALGRDDFIARVWQWKEKYGNTIIQQLRMLGASCDWDRTRFTLDAGLSRAVREVFVRLWEEELLYRAARMINWCPRCSSAISDLEVEHEKRPGTLSFLRYPLAPMPGEPPSGQNITVATTRPETMLGDTAVAVNADDPRYADLIGRSVILPLVGRHIPIIADRAVEPEFGTGAVKVTPAHDPTDFAIGQRHNLPQVQVIGFDARMTGEAGPYAGLDRYEARQRVLDDLAAQGLLDHVEQYEVSLGLCQRCETVIEPLVSTQWFVRMKPLAGPAAAAVRYGQLTIVPERFARVYLHWMDTIQDWCISRQLWWGHRIPAWYCGDCGEITVSREDPEACAHCGSATLERDPDVLDTWFSSWLWPFSTLGWPDDSEDLRIYYPTSVLETGYDILFFWVARMVFAGQHFTGVLPFHTVYLHGLVRDKQGRKMSKTIGNVIDPRDLMKQYGTDALRFTLATGGTPGNDVKLDPRRVEDGRNFVTKIWNAARFALAQDLDAAPTDALRPLSLADRWLVSRAARVTADVTRLIDGYQFGEAGRQAHDFFWGEFCDWYLEIAKIQLQDDPAAQAATRALLLHGLDISLRVLHPFIPFVTEEIWQSLPNRGTPLIVAPWPEPGARDEDAERQMGVVFDIIRFTRTARAELGLDPARRLPLIAVSAGRGALLREQARVMQTLARVDLHVVEALESPPAQALHHALSGIELYLPLEGVIDIDAERERVRQEHARMQDVLAGLRTRLANPQFVDRAPAAVVDRERERLREQEALALTLTERLRALGA